MKIILIALSILIAMGSTSAQLIEINRHGELKTLELDKDWYIVQQMGEKDDCCNSRRYLGKIVDHTQDSLLIEVSHFKTMKNDGTNVYKSQVIFNTKQDFPIYTIAKADLKYLQEKESKLSKVLTVSGGILLFTSAATAIHALIVEGDDRKALLLSSGIQIGASLGLISLGNRKKEKYVIHENAWQF